MKKMITKDQIKFISALNNALRNHIRKEILNYIELHEPITVTDLYIRFRIEQSTMSVHLGVLRRMKLVNTQQKGKFVYYSINWKVMNNLFDSIESITTKPDV